MILKDSKKILKLVVKDPKILWQVNFEQKIRHGDQQSNDDNFTETHKMF